jgi:hypothetical protein
MLPPFWLIITPCSVAWQGNPSAKRAFLKNLGSNFLLKDRTLLFSSKKPFSLLPRKGLDEDLLPFVEEIRTYFKNSQALI